MSINLNLTEIYGSIAAVLTTIAFLPQVYKTWKSKSAEDVSLKMLTLFITGLIFWIIYGMRIQSTPIIIANITTLVFNLSILILKVMHSKNNTQTKSYTNG
tara:strand:- start:243 stop:545 length:303 start_codon:yes stop_codon:yes gene_type:complete